MHDKPEKVSLFYYLQYGSGRKTSAVVLPHPKVDPSNIAKYPSNMRNYRKISVKFP